MPDHVIDEEEDTLGAISTLWSESIVENTTVISTPPDAFYANVVGYIKAFELIPLWKVKSVLSVIYGSGIVANTLLLVYLIYYKRYKSAIFCVILSLCVSDLGVCVASLLWISVFPIMLIPPWMCKVTQTVMFISFTSSSYNIVIFAALRFFQLVYPLASRAKITVSLIAKLCISIWVADLIQGITLGSFYKPMEMEYLNERIYVCAFQRSRFWFDLWLSLTWYVLPFLSTAGFHFSKHVILLCTRSSSVAMTSTSDTDQQKRKQTDTRALALVLTLYLITLLPAIVQYLRRSLFAIPRSDIEWKVTYTSEVMTLMNSAVNPWIYMFAAESVRSDIRKMCARRAD